MSKKKQILLLSFLQTLFCIHSIYAQQKMIKNIDWKVVASLPDISSSQKQLGLAGPYAGVHNDVLLIAGGSNFPDAMPWNGGKKKYRSEIYFLSKHQNKYSCKLLHDTLPNPMAYGASVSTKVGVLCIGGENENGANDHVFLLQWNKNKQHVDVQSFPSLPQPLTNCCATIIEDVVYVAGGENGKNATASFYSINLNHKSLKWEILPSLPMALSHAVVIVALNKNEQSVYVIGGRTATTSGISNLHGTVLSYHPSTQTWQTQASLPQKSGSEHLSAATAIAVNTKEAVIAGGDDGTIFHQIEKFNVAIDKADNAGEEEKLKAEKLLLINHHKGFNTTVRCYDLDAGAWHIVKSLPYSPVTTVAVLWDGEIIIPCGEIKPGIRTPKILAGKIEFK
jgi:SSS family solute:Na+ symporter